MQSFPSFKTFQPRVATSPANPLSSVVHDTEAADGEKFIKKRQERVSGQLPYL